MTSKRIARIAVFVLLIIVGGKIVIPLAIPMTLQTFFVIAAGFCLGGKDGLFACVIYMILGLAGVPVFAMGGGISYVLTPTFGFIAGFSIGAFVAGKSLYSHKTLSFWKMFASGILGLAVIYAIGAIYQTIIFVFVNGMNFWEACVMLLNLTYLFFLDAVQVALLCLIFPRASTLIKINEGLIFEKNKKATASGISKAKINDVGIDNAR